jgi:heme oxygenase (biliverdin-IX-beta and delta-forming)
MLRSSAAGPALEPDERTATVAPPSPSLFERLRAETATAHRDLEARMDLGSGALVRSRYVELLRNFRRANGAYEAVAGPALPDDLRPMFDARRKTGLLDEDLRHFGAIERERPDDLADAQRLIGGRSHAAIGAMYVFEGSTLGGAVIARHLEARLGLRTVEGRRYFTPYGGHTGAMWRAFKARIEARVGDDRAGRDAIVAAADATFAWLARLLPRGG